MQAPTTRVSVRLKSKHHKILKNLTRVYGSQQKAVERLLEYSSVNDVIADPELLEGREKLLSHPRVCILDRDILDAIITEGHTGATSLLMHVLAIFVTGKSIDEASVAEILDAVRLLFTASNLLEEVRIEFEEATGTHLLAFHYEGSLEYVTQLFVEPLRYILASKGIEPSFKLAPKYGYAIIRERIPQEAG